MSQGIAKRNDYIPRPDNDFNDFQEILVNAVNTNGAAWGIPPADVATLVGPQANWAAAWAIAKNKTNRTQTQVAAKDEARAIYETVLRRFIQQWIYDNPVMTNGQRTSCGLPPHDNTKTPAAVPEHAPEVITKLQDGHGIRFKFRYPDMEDGARILGLPNGVKLVEIVWDFELPPNGAAGCRFHSFSLKSTKLLTFPTEDEGKKAVFFARYVTSLGEAGPWSAQRWSVIP